MIIIRKKNQIDGTVSVNSYSNILNKKTSLFVIKTAVALLRGVQRRFVF